MMYSIDKDDDYDRCGVDDNICTNLPYLMAKSKRP